MKWSIEAKLGILLFVVLAVGGAAGALLALLFDDALLAIALVAIVGASPVLWLARHFARPLRKFLQGMTSAVASYKDGDFSVSLRAERNDEIGDLLSAHNDLARALREQRLELAQRELLLESVTQNSPVALILIDAHRCVVYANLAARHLLNEGRSFSGQDFTALMQHGSPSFRLAADAGEDSLFTVEIDGTEETFHLAKQAFQLQGRLHTLYSIKRLTRELARREVSTWKNLIRILSHELNNSLAPIASLADSGATLVRRGDTGELESVFAAIAERAEHLHRFILSYAALAKLPNPRPEPVEWQDFVGEIARQQRCRIVGELPSEAGWFDRAQIGQALINLLKNAHEAGGLAEEVELAITQTSAEHRVEVRDRGPGMSDTVMSQALLPFYSTKRSGTGLGLPLVREIAEAHDGRIALSNREGGGFCAAFILPRLSMPGG